MFDYCLTKQIQSRDEAERMKNNSSINAWEMWYERAIGESTAYNDMLVFLSNVAKKTGQSLDTSEWI